MGFLYDMYLGVQKKKRCTMCGCILFDDSDSDICEVCVDELYESDPGERDELNDNISSELRKFIEKEFNFKKC